MLLWLMFLSAFFSSTAVHGGDYFRSIAGVASLLPTEKAALQALRRHLNTCEATWRRVFAVAPVVRPNLRVGHSTNGAIRSGEESLLKLLRLSALDVVSQVLPGFRCPRPQIVGANSLPWPTAEDVDGAAAGICRLQKAYHITPEQALATMRSPSLAEPTADDVLSFAVHCALRERTLASEWAARGAADNRYVSFLEHYLPNMVNWPSTETSKAWRTVVGMPPETPAMWPYRDAVRGASRSSFPSDTSFGKLCHSSKEHDTRPASPLYCWLSRGKRGAASLAPFAIEALSASEPMVWLVHNFMTASECGSLRRLAETLQPAQVLKTSEQPEVQDVRTAAMSWLQKDAKTSGFYRRAEVMTGLSMESAESVQLLNYGVGGHYDHHTDPNDGWFTKKEGDRLATLLVYLSDVVEGGSTAFSEAGLSITPRLGSALFWFNLKQNSTGLWQRDTSTRHGSCPVLRGSKWIATLWIHERTQPPEFNFTLP